MQIVIDIPESIYNDLYVNNSPMYTLPQMDMYYALKNGIVLPKGHGRLIDADAVLEEPIGNTYKDIDIAETIIEADNAEGSEADADSN
jgi:hypothetical protein